MGVKRLSHPGHARTDTAEQLRHLALLPIARGQRPSRGFPRLIDHHQPAHAVAIAVIAPFAHARNVGQPSQGERPGPGIRMKLSIGSHRQRS
jgi:hypothetical protein